MRLPYEAQKKPANPPSPAFGGLWYNASNSSIDHNNTERTVTSSSRRSLTRQSPTTATPSYQQQQDSLKAMQMTSSPYHQKEQKKQSLEHMLMNNSSIMKKIAKFDQAVVKMEDDQRDDGFTSSKSLSSDAEIERAAGNFSRAVRSAERREEPFRETPPPFPPPQPPLDWISPEPELSPDEELLKQADQYSVISSDSNAATKYQAYIDAPPFEQTTPIQQPAFHNPSTPVQNGHRNAGQQHHSYMASSPRPSFFREKVEPPRQNSTPAAHPQIDYEYLSERNRQRQHRQYSQAVESSPPFHQQPERAYHGYSSQPDWQLQQQQQQQQAFIVPNTQHVHLPARQQDFPVQTNTQAHHQMQPSLQQSPQNYQYSVPQASQAQVQMYPRGDNRDTRPNVAKPTRPSPQPSRNQIGAHATIPARSNIHLQPIKPAAPAQNSFLSFLLPKCGATAINTTLSGDQEEAPVHSTLKNETEEESSEIISVDFSEQAHRESSKHQQNSYPGQSSDTKILDVTLPKSATEHRAKVRMSKDQKAPTQKKDKEVPTELSAKTSAIQFLCGSTPLTISKQENPISPEQHIRNPYLFTKDSDGTEEETSQEAHSSLSSHSEQTQLDSEERHGFQGPSEDLSSSSKSLNNQSDHTSRRSRSKTIRESVKEVLEGKNHVVVDEDSSEHYRETIDNYRTFRREREENGQDTENDLNLRNKMKRKDSWASDNGKTLELDLAAMGASNPKKQTVEEGDSTPRASGSSSRRNNFDLDSDNSILEDGEVIKALNSDRSKSRSRSRSSSKSQKTSSSSRRQSDPLPTRLQPSPRDLPPKYKQNSTEKNYTSKLGGGKESTMPWANLDFDVIASQFHRAANLGSSKDSSNGSLSDISDSTAKKLNRVRSKSLQNAERLQRENVDILSPRNRIPDALPGKKTKKYTAVETQHNDALMNCTGQNHLQQYTSCGGQAEGSMEAVNSRKIEKAPADQLKYNFDSCSSLSNEAIPAPPPRKTKSTEAAKKKLKGHYMYVAYSRFSDTAQDVIQLCEHASAPSPNHRIGEVLVQVLASNISKTDCEIRRGEWSNMQLDPYIIPGVGFIGRIDDSEKKSAFQSFKPGDMVMSLVKSGSNARYICSQRENLVKVPADVESTVAVCLVETYLAAFQALHMGQKSAIRYRKNSMHGKSVLIVGAGSSNICQAIVEVAQAAGASFVYVTGKEKSFSKISELGAVPLTRDPLDWLTLIGRQISLIICIRGNGEEITKDHMKALNGEGRIVLVGPPGAKVPVEVASPSPSKLVCRSSKHKLSERAECYNIFDSWKNDMKQCKKDLIHLLELLQQNLLNPNVLECIPLSKVAKAQSIIESKKVSGFIVCEPWIQEDLKNDFHTI